MNPLKVVLTNYPTGQVEELEAVNNPEDPSAGTRKVPFSRQLYIDEDDFRVAPPPKYFRLAPGREVRLRYGYFIKCIDLIKDEHGKVIELRCTYDPETRGGYAPDGRKVQGTLHWVSASHALDAEVRLYDRLFARPEPELRTGLMQRGWAFLTYALALVLLLSISYSLWVILIFPGWVLAVSVYFLILNFRGQRQDALKEI